MEEWRRTLLPRIAESKARLQGVSLADLARRSGAMWTGSTLILEFLGTPFQLTSDLSLLKSDGSPAQEEVQALIFDYLVNAQGRKPRGQWIGFRELPHGTFYARTFQSYTGDELVRRLDREKFQKAAERAGGVPIPLGDLAYTFYPLPLLALAVLWWDAEEELPPQAMVLFDVTAADLLPTEGLAIVGRLLCQRLIKLAEEG